MIFSVPFVAGAAAQFFSTCVPWVLCVPLFLLSVLWLHFMSAFSILVLLVAFHLAESGCRQGDGGPSVLGQIWPAGETVTPDSAVRLATCIFPLGGGWQTLGQTHGMIMGSGWTVEGCVMADPL